MIKKLLLGMFIVYNVFAMSAYTYAAESMYQDSVFTSDSSEKEAVDTDIKESADTSTVEDANSDSKDQKGGDEKNGGDISITPDILDSTGCDSTGTPSVTVLSPNGGEVYTTGQQITVKWETCNIPSGMNALIILNDEINGVGGDLATSTPNDGVEIVTLPTSATWPGPFGTYFKVRVSFVPFGGYSGMQLSDASDNLFTINSAVTYPAGCTSALGYSPTTGVPCTNPVTWLVGCTSANGYSTFNGQPCNWTIVYPNVPQGCVTTQGFSVTTGQLCSGYATPFCDPNDSTTVPTVEVLSPNGGEHYISAEMPVTWRTCMIPSNTIMKIDLLMLRPNAPTLTRNLATTINDGTQVVALPNATTWPEIIYGNNFKVRIYLAYGPSYGPSDQSNGNFSIAPATLIISTDPSTPPMRVVEVSQSSSTDDVVLLKGKFKAENSDVLLKDVPFTFTTVGGANVAALVESAYLYIDGDLYGQEDVSFMSSTTGTVVFNDVDFDLDSGDTSSFTIKADINPITPGFFDEGDSLSASLTDADRNNVYAEDENGDDLLSSQKTGVATGNPQIFRTYGVLVNTVSTSQVSTIDSNGDVTQVTFKAVLDVTAFGRDSYVSNGAQLATTATGTNALAYVFENANNPNIPDVTSIAVANFLSNIGDYSIEEGDTNRFTLTTILLTPSIPNSFYRVALKEIRIFDNALLTTGALNIPLLPPDSYRTGYAFINN